MNVALTRCRKGMVVVTDKCFLQRMGNMLLGELCHTWSQRHEACWIDWKAMLNNSAALPGLPLPLPRPIPLYGMLNPAPAVQQLALHRPQRLQALTRINEQSRPNPIHSPSRRTAMLPRNPPPSKPKTRAWESTPTAAAAAPRELDDDAFPSLQQLATAVDQSSGSRHRMSKRW
ncbi:hypothetical protein DFH94DRAFT_646017 [Russula ochroleuca]|jgi:hypothetical protein|uniref:DNA2/NAM7 helicase-like C-terminal domain-containing protein n=1 Tax=Russula ochroleuca TaxID=152965 RepID=A0A9P5N1A7_9AGAM|nr:hypothetical protein DFH94DRAFT_646017 [Russula ochroleuca]